MSREMARRLSSSTVFVRFVCIYTTFIPKHSTNRLFLSICHLNILINIRIFSSVHPFVRPSRHNHWRRFHRPRHFLLRGWIPAAEPAVKGCRPRPGTGRTRQPPDAEINLLATHNSPRPRPMTWDFRVLKLKIRILFKFIQSSSTFRFVNSSFTWPQHRLPGTCNCRPRYRVVIVTEVDVGKVNAVHGFPYLSFVSNRRLFFHAKALKKKRI